MRLVLLGIALAAGGALTLVVAGRRRSDRGVRHQLRHLARCLQVGGPDADPSGDVAEMLSRLSRRADDVVQRADRCQALTSLMSTALEAVPLGVVIAGGDGRVLFRNGPAATMAGGRPADALAMQAVAELLAVARAGSSDSRILELHGPPRRTLALSAVPLSDHGDGRPAAVVVEDISERRRLDLVRRDFVANVSHELKTPVGALGLLAETLATEDDDEVVRRLAGRMQTEAFRVARIIEDLLDLSRLEAEEEAGHEQVLIHTVVAQAVELATPAAKLRGVTLEVAERPGDWVVLGDRRHLVSALFNLLDNALKYSDPGSTVHVGTAVADGKVDLVVEDHGIGIPSGDLDRIFERFYRVDTGRGRDTGGTGLGLAIVRHVAHNHGGEVLVASREGEGSTFTLRVPGFRTEASIGAEAG